MTQAYERSVGMECHLLNETFDVSIYFYYVQAINTWKVSASANGPLPLGTCREFSQYAEARDFFFAYIGLYVMDFNAEIIRRST